jgi:hypothetical protein
MGLYHQIIFFKYINNKVVSQFRLTSENLNICLRIEWKIIKFHFHGINFGILSNGIG